MAAIGTGWVDGAWIEAGWVANPGAWASAADPASAIAATSASLTEALIVAGGETITITLSNDTWVTAGATFNAQRQAIINGLDAASSPALGWNDEVRDKEVVGAVVRTSDTVVTITLTASPLYDISATETVTVTIPAAALTGGVEVTATPTFDVAFIAEAVAQIIEGAGSGQYKPLPYGNEDIARWLENYFPESKQTTPELGFDNEAQDETETETETVLVVPHVSILRELSRLAKIEDLYNESLRLETRANTAKAERKLRQIVRDREDIRQQVTALAAKIKRRKRQDEQAILAIIEELV